MDENEILTPEEEITAEEVMPDVPEDDPEEWDRKRKEAWEAELAPFKALRAQINEHDDAWFRWLMRTIINNPDVPFGLPPGMKPDDCPRWRRLYDVGMPIGNLTSQETANLFLDKLDQFIKRTLKVHYYVRYMDDFCILVKA